MFYGNKTQKRLLWTQLHRKSHFGNHSRHFMDFGRCHEIYGRQNRRRYSSSYPWLEHHLDSGHRFHDCEKVYFQNPSLLI